VCGQSHSGLPVTCSLPNCRQTDKQARAPPGTPSAAEAPPLRGVPAETPPGAAAGVPLPIDAAVNGLLARVGFDLLRSADFKEGVAAHVQRKINGLRTPDYLQSIEARRELLR